MRSILSLSVLCLAVVVASGCASDGSFRNPFASDEAPSASGYFFSEFSDIPIPNELSESRNDTFITFAQSGVKCGTQRFTGRVEVVSLMNTMRRHMAAHGWTLRSLLRAKESTLVFEKPDRVATFQFSDGLFTTEMRLFVSSRLDGDAGSMSTGAPAASGTAASSGTQRLSN